MQAIPVLPPLPQSRVPPPPTLVIHLPGPPSPHTRQPPLTALVAFRYIGDSSTPVAFVMLGANSAAKFRKAWSSGGGGGGGGGGVQDLGSEEDIKGQMH